MHWLACASGLLYHCANSSGDCCALASDTSGDPDAQ